MNTIDWQFIFNLITAITSIIAIIFTCFSVLSAKKQEFELNRGNVVAYIDYDIVYTNAFLVVKNFGKSIATINSIKPNIDIPVYIDNNSDKYKIYNYSNYTLVPNQKVYNQIDIKKILGKTINIKCRRLKSHAVSPQPLHKQLDPYHDEGVGQPRQDDPKPRSTEGAEEDRVLQQGVRDGQMVVQ